MRNLFKRSKSPTKTDCLLEQLKTELIIDVNKTMLDLQKLKIKILSCTSIRKLLFVILKNEISKTKHLIENIESYFM